MLFTAVAPPPDTPKAVELVEALAAMAAAAEMVSIFDAFAAVTDRSPAAVTVPTPEISALVMA